MFFFSYLGLLLETHKNRIAMDTILLMYPLSKLLPFMGINIGIREWCERCEEIQSRRRKRKWALSKKEEEALNAMQIDNVLRLVPARETGSQGVTFHTPH